MPNWCYNDINIEGKAGKVHEFLTKLVGKAQKLFESHDDSMKHMLEMTLEERIIALKELTEAQEESLTYSILVPQPENILADGGEEWYSWRIANWGVKWDIDDTTADIEYIRQITKEVALKNPDEMYSNALLNYDTPWSAPYAFFQKVSKDFELKFVIYSSEPGDAFFSHVEIENGEIHHIFETRGEMVWRCYEAKVGLDDNSFIDILISFMNDYIDTLMEHKDSQELPCYVDQQLEYLKAYLSDNKEKIDLKDFKVEALKYFSEEIVDKICSKLI